MTGTKIDTIKIRQLNREQTFEYIKKNPMAARADVAKELNLSFPTVTSIVTELEEAGLIRAEKSTTNTGGRSSMAYSCDENARCAIGIQLSERYMKGLVLNLQGNVIGNVITEKLKFRSDDNYRRKIGELYQRLVREMGLKEGDEIAVLVNGLGSTPLLELNLVFYELHKRMHKDGLKIYDTEIKTYCTCMEMGGFSITFLKLDDELKPYYDAPCYSPYYAKGSVSGEAIEDDGEDEEIEFDENDVKPAEIVRSKEGELTELNAEDTRNMLLYIADKIIANKPYLTEIDSAIGDGDHGIGMAGGMQKAKKKLLKMAGEENAYQLFETAGQAMLMSMGGASGVIFGSLYLAGAKGMDPKSVIT